MFLHTFTNIFVKENVWYLWLFPSLSSISLDYKTMEAWLPSWINANSTFVQYPFHCSFDMLLQTPYANSMRGLMFIV